MRDKHKTGKQASLEELLSEPIVWMMMKADRVEECELRDLLKRVSAELSRAKDADDQIGEVMGPMERDERYRTGVGIMLLNERNEALVGRRANTEGEAWQMPQGGIDEGENPRAAAFRDIGQVFLAFCGRCQEIICHFRKDLLSVRSFHYPIFSCCGPLKAPAMEPPGLARRISCRTEC